LGWIISKKYLIALVLSLSIRLLPQSHQLEINKDIFRVDSILISGNNSTKEFVILNELTFKQGNFISNYDLEFNKERIYSLGLFNKVNLDKIEKQQKVFVEIKVEESWYIFPIPFARLNERDFKKLSYGLNLIYKNFRGRNETILGTISFGYNPAYGFSYINPNLTSGGDYFLKFSAYSSITNNQSLIAELKNESQFDYKKIFSSMLIGKRLNQFNKIYLTFSYHYIETKDLKIPFTISSDRIDRFPTIELGYEFDSRDLIQFPKNGNYFFLLGSAKGLNLNNQINYQTLKTDIRFYSKLFDELFFKTRNFTRFTIGKKIPIYDYSIIGTEEKIRGSFFKKIEDRNLFLLSSEFFIPLLRELYLNLDFIPIIPERLLNYRIEIYAHTFFDYGLVFKKQIKSKNELNGFGIGLSFLILPFNVIRFEIGYNKFSKPEFIIDLGKFF